MLSKFIVAENSSRIMAGYVSPEGDHDGSNASELHPRVAKERAWILEEYPISVAEERLWLVSFYGAASGLVFSYGLFGHVSSENLLRTLRQAIALHGAPEQVSATSTIRISSPSLLSRFLCLLQKAFKILGATQFGS
jgi:hypothetical protein